VGTGGKAAGGVNLITHLHSVPRSSLYYAYLCIWLVGWSVGDTLVISFTHLRCGLPKLIFSKDLVTKIRYAYCSTHPSHTQNIPLLFIYLL